MQRSLTLKAFYPHPPERVWQALTCQQTLAIWLMDNSFEPRLGHRFKFQDRTLPGLTRVIDCEVIALDPPKRLVYTWQESWMQIPSRVTWVLTPVTEGTQIELHHSGLTSTISASSPIYQLQGQFEGPGALASLTATQTINRSKRHPVLEREPQTLWGLPYETEWNHRLKDILPAALKQLQNG